MASKKIKAPRAVSEATLAACLCKAVGCQLAETVDEAKSLAGETTGMALFANTWIPYAWTVPVAASVMADKAEGLASDVLMTPGVVFLVKDSVSRPGKDLFLVWCGNSFPAKGLPFRAVVNHFDVCGETERVTAVQLSSCLR